MASSVSLNDSPQDMETRAPQQKPSLDAESMAVTYAKGLQTNGILNQHPSSISTTSRDRTSDASSDPASLPFRIGVSEDRNKRWRRTMEDSHAFVYDFGNVAGQGFFGVFDGHAGKHAAEWCGQNFHTYLLDTLASNQDAAVPDILNKTFHAVDHKLSALAKEQGTTSGCTAVVAFLRLEDDNGRPMPSGHVEPSQSASSSSAGGAGTQQQGLAKSTSGSTSDSDGLWSRMSRRLDGSSGTKLAKQQDGAPESPGIRRVLYTANVGDARAVLCRGGSAVRLTYDHKGSDAQEAKRITDAGGFVMNHRVNGVLAVTRSLGDSAMKEFVVGSPYTTETVLTQEDTFLIVACDGLWDVTQDQDAVDLVADERDPQAASQKLLQHALSNFSTDNTSVMVIRFGPPGATVLTGQASKGTV